MNLYLIGMVGLSWQTNSMNKSSNQHGNCRFLSERKRMVGVVEVMKMLFAFFSFVHQFWMAIRSNPPVYTLWKWWGGYTLWKWWGGYTLWKWWGGYDEVGGYVSEQNLCILRFMIVWIVLSRSGLGDSKELLGIITVCCVCYNLLHVPTHARVCVTPPINKSFTTKNVWPWCSFQNIDYWYVVICDYVLNTNIHNNNTTTTLFTTTTYYYYYYSIHNLLLLLYSQQQQQQHYYYY